ncbi:hypothetical protein PESP_b0477 [Pseudoalteromonas espejiana DSM 9414]|uniref:Uncharacterized protein n=1 Tax=Pseudoalteromonas espejiana TaxID=28107 RepID=A0A510XTE0_9GAMM|nr:hypothetical protein [Pseudoalteromonas espejiana]ASM52030.1 hypothetical protein PESP_b0477 [Pseudoalteromonas espejiana DSM 9414]GEK54289.1 hypothetical protein PES01_11340 [Pseudoalteromonas espejiana]
MGQDCCLYANGERHLYPSIAKAHEAAEQFICFKVDLRLEYLFETTGADFWAYEYNQNKWVPS